MLLGGQTTKFHMNATLPIASYNNGVGFPILFAYRPKATPFAGEACETNRSLVRTESCWKTRVTVLLHCLQPSRKFQLVSSPDPPHHAHFGKLDREKWKEGLVNGLTTPCSSAGMLAELTRQMIIIAGGEPELCFWRYAN